MLNAVLGDQMKLTVNLTVRMLRAEKNSRRANGLQAPLMIEWEVSPSSGVYRYQTRIPAIPPWLPGLMNQ
jgi:hypothetical protein